MPGVIAFLDDGNTDIAVRVAEFLEFLVLSSLIGSLRSSQALEFDDHGQMAGCLRGRQCSALEQGSVLRIWLDRFLRLRCKAPSLLDW